MDSTAKVAEIAWKGAYMFKLDHKMDFSMYQLMLNPGNILAFIGREFYVLCVLPFGCKSSPYIYHTLTEAVNMYWLD